MDTTASYSSTMSYAFWTSLRLSASPLERNAPIFSISARSSFLRWRTVTHVPASLSWRTTSMHTPDPPATSTEMLSGSRSARAPRALGAARTALGAARKALGATRDLNERREAEAASGGERRTSGNPPRRDGIADGARPRRFSRTDVSDPTVQSTTSERARASRGGLDGIVEQGRGETHRTC